MPQCRQLGQCCGMHHDGEQSFSGSLSISRSMREAPSRSRLQTMRKRLGTVEVSDPCGPLTQTRGPHVPARSPAPSVDCTSISIEEMLMCGGTPRRGFELRR